MTRPFTIRSAAMFMFKLEIAMALGALVIAAAIAYIAFQMMGGWFS